MAKRPDAKLAEAVQEAAGQPLDQTILLSLVGYNLRRAYVKIMPDFDDRVGKLQLRAVDFAVLSLLNANPNITQKRLSRAVNVSPPNLAILLDRLEARGLLVRQRNPLDKRSQTLVLTPEGSKLCVKAEKIVFDLERKATAMLSDVERTQLVTLLQKVFLEAPPSPEQ
jgi:DNA-binding MarR family transcriptional regulator